MTSVAATQFLPVVATPSATKDSLVVSIHDVAPATQSIAKRSSLNSRNGEFAICSLLVVPNYHHRGHRHEDREFVSWLRQLEAAGHEIVIHGYFHERPRSECNGSVDKCRDSIYTQDEGEFYDLDYDEALRRITTAREISRRPD